MIELLSSTTKIRFMNYRIPFIIFSGTLTLLSWYFIATKGFNYGVDFAGGIEMVLELAKDSHPSDEALRKSFKRMGIEDASVQTFGQEQKADSSQYIVHFPAQFTHEEVASKKLAESLVKMGKAAPGEVVVQQFRFTGLEKAYVTFSKTLPLSDVKAAVAQIPFGLLQLADVQGFGRDAANEFQLTFKSITQILQDELSKDFKSAAKEPVKIQKVDFVGAKVGRDLKVGAILSLLVTALLIFLYIFIRFDFHYAPGVVIAAIHDVSITAGVFSLLGLDFDLTIVAALLTLAGYSINDTIIVYDRIREVSGRLRGKTFADIIDIAVNQTLSRTIITSGTVFIATGCLYLFGGPVIHGFGFAFLIGVIVGTYSSVFVAAPLILWTDQWVKGRETKPKRQAA